MTPIERIIGEWMSSTANNCIEPGSALPAFDPPLVGFAAGNDELFTFFKYDIGPEFYWTPLEAFSAAFPGEEVESHELTVIGWVLPQTRETRMAHRQACDLPSIQWSKARLYGEQVNEKLRRFVVDELSRQGHQGCAPTLLPQWNRAQSSRYGYASCWSERHAVHACGLGTFGLSDGLITPAGKAVRVGSVIVRKRIPATPRSYDKPNQWCLFQMGKPCSACIRRCPVEAITPAGHDKEKCKKYIRTITAPFVEQEQLGVRVNSCGLCQTKVPCEARNPFDLKTGKE